ncbi:MAG TPA: cell wall metabolism sensor histidine kinase WalK [Clostridiaceae bacterium]|nr:cell wall metabolism sensor histidine kinase WalK [Clostridiaceae bacterium]
MFKSLFSKLVAMFIATIIFSFSIAGITLYYTLGVYVSEEKVRNLDLSGEEISKYLGIYLDNLGNPIAQVMLEYVMDSYRQNTGAYIWITNQKGIIVFSSPNVRLIDKRVVNNLKFEQGYYGLPDERQYKNVFLGIDPVIEKGDFYGLFKETGWSWLVVQKPFKYKDTGGDEQVVAAIYLITPISEVHKTRSTVYRFFLISIIVSILVSTSLVYFFSRKITKPLKEIRDAAKVISEGEFDKRLNINSKDEIGELAKSFNQMAADLERLEEMRRGFIANVSHELRTPMTSIKGFIEGILDDVIPQEKHKEYLEIVRNEIARLNRLVNDLLDLAKMESGELQLVYTNFNINELIRRCIIKLESIITEKGLEVIANFDEDTLVTADIDAIERVLINLIHNAVKFTPSGGIIGVNTEIDNNNDKVIISIADTGIGISKEDLDRIWERFYKVDKSRSLDTLGTGLGLSIVKNIVMEHGEKIWVESEVGKGTTFYFTLKKAKNAYKN